MDPEYAQWAVLVFLVWRVFALEASQLRKSDLKPIHANLADILRIQEEANRR